MLPDSRFFTQTRKIMASGLQNTGLQWVVLYFFERRKPYELS